jgi:hypothetical protein
LSGNTYIAGDLIVGGDCTITASGNTLKPIYNEYFSVGIDWPATSYLYPITNAVSGADYKIRFASTATFVAKTSKVRIVTHGNISVPTTTSTTIVWGCLATNNAATTFIYPVCGSATSGWVGPCNTNYYKGDFVSSHMYLVTPGTTYWLAVRFTPSFNGVLNMTASNVVVEHMNSWK